MAKHECLTISRRVSLRGKRLLEETRYEMLGTVGNIRLIDVIEADTVGKRTTYRHQHKKMALPEGKYIAETPWDATQKDKFKKMISEWQALPIKEVYKQLAGVTAIESRYLKTED